MRLCSFIKKTISVLSAAAAVLCAGYIPTEASVEDVYQKIYSALVRGETSFDLGRGISLDDVTAAVDRIRSEAPEICWFGACSYTYSSSYFNFTATPVEGFSEDKLAEYCYELEAKANAVAREASKRQGDREKLKYVHDYLVNNCDYDYSSKNSATTKPAHTAYGCLIDHKAVCSGYSDAFMLIVKKLGFECGTVSGIATESHAWNYVRLGGNYYWVDVTWDDPTYEEGNKPLTADIPQNYFLIDDDLLYRSRTADNENPFVPVCTSLDLYQYSMDGAVFDYFDQNMISDLIEKHYGEGYTEFMFTSASDFQNCISFLHSSDVWGLKALSGRKEGIQFSYNDDLYNVTLVFDSTAANSASFDLPQEVFPEAADYQSGPGDTGDVSQAVTAESRSAAPTAESQAAQTAARKDPSDNTSKAQAAVTDIDTDPGKESSGGFGWLIPVGIGAAVFAAVFAVLKSRKKASPVRAAQPPAGSVQQNYPGTTPCNTGTSDLDAEFFKTYYSDDSNDYEYIDRCFDDYSSF